MSRKTELIIKNATVVDGTGNPGFKADIAVGEGKITNIGRHIPEAIGVKVLQAEGLCAGPGFIDTHSHDDAYLLINPDCNEKIQQGITTVVTGNCGFSMAPISDRHRTEMQKTAAILGGNHLPDGFFDLSSFDGFLSKLEEVRPGINVAPLVGHAAIRIAVLGLGNRTPTPDELNKMKRLTSQSLEEGAIGLSTGLIYFPAHHAKTGELVELAKIAGRSGGIYATHMRNESDFEMEAIEEAFEIGRQADIPVHISHHKIAGRTNWGRSEETLSAFEKARADGIQVTCDQYPYLAGSTYLAALLPPQIQAESPDVFARKLKDPAVRKRVRGEIEAGLIGHWENLIKGAGFEAIIVSSAPRHTEYLGKSLADIAENEDRDPFDVLFDLLAVEKLAATMVIFLMNEEDVVRIMKSPLTMIGTDGIPGFGSNKFHPRMSGTFPRILGRYVRDKGELGLEEAVRKMTSLPAQTFGLKRKGLLREGFDADIVLFNPFTVIDMSTFEEPRQAPVGIEWVLVNGEIAVENGRVTGARSGRVLRRGRG